MCACDWSKSRHVTNIIYMAILPPQDISAFMTIHACK